jgi:hypothetical protein
MDGKKFHQILACKNLRMLEINKQQQYFYMPQQNFSITKKKESNDVPNSISLD